MKHIYLALPTLFLLSMTAALCAEEAPSAIRAWDTMTALPGSVLPASRQDWRAYDLKSPLHGDLVIETGTVTVAFASKVGSVLLSTAGDSIIKAIVFPTDFFDKTTALSHVMVTTGEENPVMVHATFSSTGTGDRLTLFSFAEPGIVGIWPKDDAHRIAVTAPYRYALVPSFVGDDLIYDRSASESLALVSEHVLLGLLQGDHDELVMTWQQDIPTIRWRGGPNNPEASTVSFEGGDGIFLSLLSAPRIWHREPLKPDYLEQDIAIGWKPPFPAIWLTQLYEDEVKTTFEFRDAKEDTWRGGVGFYTFPTWFNGTKTMLTLGKKIPPEGDAVIYCLERNDATPRSVVTPMDIVSLTLTGDVLSAILDVEGRPAWYPHRPDSVLGGATCGVTDAMLKIFREGKEVEQKSIIKGGVEDMYAYLNGMFERNARFYPFAREMVSYLTAQEKANPKLVPWLRELRATAEEIVTTYDDARDTFRDINYAHELGAKTIALTTEKRSENLKRLRELKQAWTGMGGALEELARREHTLTRKLYQQAGYGVATRPEAMPIAMEIRKRTKQCLEKPESYEIWENY